MDSGQIEDMLERFKSANVMLVDADCIGNVKFPEIINDNLFNVVDEAILDKLKSGNIILVDSRKIGDVKPPEVGKDYIFYLLE